MKGKLNHKKIWAAIVVGNLMLFVYSYYVNIDHQYTMQIVAADMVVYSLFIVAGAYIGGFILKALKKSHNPSAS